MSVSCPFHPNSPTLLVITGTLSTANSVRSFRPWCPLENPLQLPLPLPPALASYPCLLSSFVPDPTLRPHHLPTVQPNCGLQDEITLTSAYVLSSSTLKSGIQVCASCADRDELPFLPHAYD